MHNPSWISLLAATATAAVPTLDSVTCNGKDAMTATISSSANLGKFQIRCQNNGNENEMDATASESDDGNGGFQYSSTFNPYTCTGQTLDSASLQSYSVAVEIYFAEKTVIGGADVYQQAHYFDLSCDFADEYDLVSSLTGVEMQFEDQGEGSFTPSFALQRADSNYQVLDENASVDLNVGEAIHFVVSSAISLDSFDFAPTFCKVADLDSGVEVTVFDIADATCGVDAVNFGLDFDAGVWKMNFEAFSLDPYGNHNYELRCKTNLCSKDDSDSQCAAVSDACDDTPDYNGTPDTDANGNPLW